MNLIKNLLYIILFTIFSFTANAACKFDLNFGDDFSKIENKYGPALPAMFPEIQILPVQAIEICPNENNQRYLETKRDKLGHLFSKY